MFQAIRDNKTSYIILSYILLIGLSLYLTGYFWQAKTTRLQTLYYFFVVAPILVSIIYQVKNYPFNTLFFLSFLFILYSMSSVFWSEDVSAQALFHQTKKVILLLSLFFAINHVCRKFPDFEINILNVMTFFASCLAIYNIYTLITTVGLGERINGWGLLDNANVTAQVFGLIFIFSFMQFLKTRDRIKVITYLLIALLILFEIFLNKSRGQQLALIIATVLILFAVPRDHLKRLIPVGIAATIAVLYVLFSTNIFETVFNRELTYSCRDTIWKELWSSAMQTPLFGRGEGSSPGFISYCPDLKKNITDAHSVYMDTLIYTGFTGIILALLPTIYAIKSIYKSKNSDDYFWGIILIYGFIAFIPNGDSLVSRPNEVWILFWVPLAFIASRQTANLKQTH